MILVRWSIEWLVSVVVVWCIHTVCVHMSQTMIAHTKQTAIRDMQQAADDIRMDSMERRAAVDIYLNHHIHCIRHNRHSLNFANMMTIELD